MTTGYLPPPDTPGNETPSALFRHARQVAAAAKLAMQGKVNAVATVTLTAGAASTVWKDPRLTSTAAVVFDPMTANAAAELAAGTLYTTSANRLNGQWTLTHANAVSTDRTFRALIIG